MYQEEIASRGLSSIDQLRCREGVVEGGARGVLQRGLPHEALHRLRCVVAVLPTRYTFTGSLVVLKQTFAVL